jgi:hypothetical protein
MKLCSSDRNDQMSTRVVANLSLRAYFQVQRFFTVHVMNMLTGLVSLPVHNDIWQDHECVAKLSS